MDNIELIKLTVPVAVTATIERVLKQLPEMFGGYNFIERFCIENEDVITELNEFEGKDNEEKYKRMIEFTVREFAHYFTNEAILNKMKNDIAKEILRRLK